ncbi:MAG TPA: FkbM family methyltransferase [Bryobacteraceae bacterium]|nr:FkbM family methyltransferase [Bryobacteraceae bacterium]
MSDEKSVEAAIQPGFNRARRPLTIARISLALKRRLQLARHGIFSLPGQEIRIASVRIGNRTVPIVLPEEERRVQEFELANMVYFDCYGLSRVRRPVSTVLDIGANLGFFALAARRRFPEAKIHSYEPNQDLEPFLAAHCSAAGADYFVEAVGASPGRVNLDRHQSTLHTVARESEDGSTPQVAFADAVARLGTVDLVKLDCEGAEWDIFSDPRPWANVRHLAMEYHLWARPSLSVDHLRHHLSALGFSEIVIEPDPAGNWGMAWGRRN